MNEEAEKSDIGSAANSRMNSNIDCIDGNETFCETGSSSMLNEDGENGEVKREAEVCPEQDIKNIEGFNSNKKVNESLQLLEEIRMRIDEPELSQEQLRINSCLQKDELLAMEYIYGDDIFILDSCSDLRKFQISVHVDVPKGFRVIANFDNRPEFSYSFGVEYLPPITLTCSLTQSYPSNLAPFFTISVQWLNSDKIVNLCHKLDSIWEEVAGQEVIYQWVEWLRCNALSHLGLNEKIVIGPHGIMHEDFRAVSEGISSEIDIHYLKSYSGERSIENFRCNMQECSICFCEFLGSDFIMLPCRHYFCSKCMTTFSKTHIKEGTVMKLLCPFPKCGGMIPPGLLKRLLGEEEFKKWESLMLQKTLESMSDIIDCPRCETPCLEDEDHHAQCSKCYYNFCTLCRERRHVGVACMSLEMKLVILQERQNSSQIKDEQRRREKDMINQILSVRAITSFAKQCPSCKMAISHSGGCNKMSCDNCGTYFCYRCNKAIDGYDHFKDGSCELFPQGEIERWEEENGHRVIGQIQAHLFADRARRCPNCGQDNAKMDNNNHIFCWACQCHYCYLCKELVRRSSQHYGPKGCKQHTVG